MYVVRSENIKANTNNANTIANTNANANKVWRQCECLMANAW